MLRLMLALLVALVSSGARSQSTIYVGDERNLVPGQVYLIPVKCPDTYFPDHWFSETDPPFDDVSLKVIDASGNFLSSTPSANDLVGAGFSWALSIPAGGSPTRFRVTVRCVKDPPASVTTVHTQVSVPANGAANASAACPAGAVPLSMLPHVDNSNVLRTSTSYFMGSAQTPVPFDTLPDGIAAPPVGINVGLRNTTGSPRTVPASLICAFMPDMSTRIVSTPTQPGKIYEVGAVVPDDFDVYGFAVLGAGTGGSVDANAAWSTDGAVTTQLRYAGGVGAGPATVRGIFVNGRDARPPAPAQKVAGRATVAMLLQPATGSPPPVTTNVVEFYNPSLDHYFVTANAKEISDLDNGVHKGWARTGASFKAYAARSSGKTTRRPVCRAYGNPAMGLDSHFYSASPQECVATLSSFNGAWLLEASEVFQMDLPDATTGQCPAAGVPIYRVWNKRADSNHRYTTSLAAQAEMVAKGYIAEGYGPNAVTLCALP